MEDLYSNEDAEPRTDKSSVQVTRSVEEERAQPRRGGAERGRAGTSPGGKVVFKGRGIQRAKKKIRDFSTPALLSSS